MEVDWLFRAEVFEAEQAGLSLKSHHSLLLLRDLSVDGKHFEVEQHLVKVCIGCNLSEDSGRVVVLEIDPSVLHHYNGLLQALKQFAIFLRDLFDNF